MAETGGNENLSRPPPELVTVSGTVRGGSGWNDPPITRFSPARPPGQQLDRRLNRLPAAESGSASIADGQSQLLNTVQLYPPMAGTDPSNYIAPIIVPTMPSNGSCVGSGLTAKNPVTLATVAVRTSDSDAGLSVPEFEDDEQMFHYVVTRLQRALKDSQAGTDHRAYEEMARKVNIFSDMWKNGKISYPVKSTMARLATAIHKRRCDDADHLHLSLMVDHVSEVSKWLVGIKRLIQLVRNTDAPLSPSCLLTPTSTPHSNASDEGRSVDERSAFVAPHRHPSTESPMNSNGSGSATAAVAVAASATSPLLIAASEFDQNPAIQLASITAPLEAADAAFILLPAGGGAGGKADVSSAQVDCNLSDRLAANTLSAGTADESSAGSQSGIEEAAVKNFDAENCEKSSLVESTTDDTLRRDENCPATSARTPEDVASANSVASLTS